MRLSGLNINAQLLSSEVKTWLLGILKSMNSLSHTTMDDWQFTLEASQAMPNTLWAHRAWNPFFVRDDTRTYLEKTPEQWAQWVGNFEQRPNIYHHMLNEPSSDDVPKLVDWLIEAMSLTGRNGKYPQKCIVGNFAVDKSFQHQGDSIRWQDDWLRFYRELAKHQGWHMAGYHRYWIGDIRLAYVSGYPANIRLDYPTHKDYQDPSKHRLSLERLPNGELPPHWTGYADLWIKKLCLENNIPITDEMITEDWLDEKRDPGSLPYNKYVDDNYPTEYDNGNGRGIWTWRAWSEASTGKPYIVALKNQLEAKNTMHLSLAKQYPQLKGKQKGTHLFSFTPSADWEHAGHSIYTPPHGGGKYDIRLQLIQAMTQVNEFKEDTMTQPTPIEPFNPTLYEADVRVTTGTWNMRPIMVASPAVEVIGELTTQSRPMLVSKERAQGSTYEWYKFKEGDVTGYFAHTEKLEIQYKADTTPDEPTEPDDTPTDTSELIARLDALEVTNTALNERITALENAITKMLEPVILDAPDVSWTAPRFALPMVASMFAGLERQFSIQKEWAQSGTPTPPVSAQNIKFPRSPADVHSIADVGFQFNPNPAMINEDGNITITNEPADDTNEQTLTDIMLNGDDSEGDDDIDMPEAV